MNDNILTRFVQEIKSAKNDKEIVNILLRVSALAEKETKEYRV